MLAYNMLPSACWPVDCISCGVVPLATSGETPTMLGPDCAEGQPLPKSHLLLKSCHCCTLTVARTPLKLAQQMQQQQLLLFALLLPPRQPSLSTLFPQNCHPPFL